jgi:hypothetical protein
MATTETAHPPAIPKMKMTTPIPPSITTPESVDTRIGTLKFFDGFPDDSTVQRVYDNLDFSILLRLYGPLHSWFDKTWQPWEFELVK